MPARIRNRLLLRSYGNLSGNSGVLAYAIGKNRIELLFAGDCKRYVYTAARPGAARLREMKCFAEDGRGLSGFVSQYVKDEYDHTIPLEADEIARWCRY